jgi:hypothetical protein
MAHEIHDAQRENKAKEHQNYWATMPFPACDFIHKSKVFGFCDNAPVDRASKASKGTAKVEHPSGWVRIQGDMTYVSMATFVLHPVTVCCMLI